MNSLIEMIISEIEDAIDKEEKCKNKRDTDINDLYTKLHKLEKSHNKSSFIPPNSQTSIPPSVPSSKDPSSSGPIWSDIIHIGNPSSNHKETPYGSGSGT